MLGKDYEFAIEEKASKNSVEDLPSRIDFSELYRYLKQELHGIEDKDINGSTRIVDLYKKLQEHGSKIGIGFDYKLTSDVLIKCLVENGCDIDNIKKVICGVYISEKFAELKGNDFVVPIVRSLVDVAMQKIEANRDVVLVLGNSGEGKSTLINHLIGTELVVKEKNSAGRKICFLEIKEGSCESNKLDKRPAIGNAGQSKTAFPNKWSDGVVDYWDCPGFGDTRSVEQDIANAFYIKRLFESSKSFKVVAVIAHDAFADERFTKFESLLKSFNDLFPDFNNIENSVSFAITKATKEFDLINFKEWVGSEELSDQERFKNNKVFKYFASADSKIGYSTKVLSKEDIFNEIDIKKNLELSVPASLKEVRVSIDPKSEICIKDMCHDLEKKISKQVDHFFKNDVRDVIIKDRDSGDGLIGLDIYSRVRDIETYVEFIGFMSERLAIDKEIGFKMFKYRSDNQDIEFFSLIVPINVKDVFIREAGNILNTAVDAMGSSMKTHYQVFERDFGKELVCYLESLGTDNKTEMKEIEKDIATHEKILEIIKNNEREGIVEKLSEMHSGNSANDFKGYLDRVETVVKKVGQVAIEKAKQVKTDLDAKVKNSEVICGLVSACGRSMIDNKKRQEGLQEAYKKIEDENRKAQELIRARAEEDKIKYKDDIEQLNRVHEEEKKAIAAAAEKEKQQIKDENQRSKDTEKAKKEEMLKNVARAISNVIGDDNGVFYGGKDNGYKIVYSKKLVTSEVSFAKKTCLFAFDKITIDSNVNLGGCSNLIIVAPNWKIDGNFSINLNGENGSSYYYRASSGSDAGQALRNGSRGSDGIRGGDGKSAGHFYGFGRDFTGLEKLTIFANGGIGGKGQDGGNGGDGRRAKFVYRADSDHTNGGDGGNGGNGGDGGRAGSAKLIKSSGKNNIISDIAKFYMGDGGGGTGGTGGSSGSGGIVYGSFTSASGYSGRAGTSGTSGYSGSAVENEFQMSGAGVEKLFMRAITDIAKKAAKEGDKEAQNEIYDCVEPYFDDFLSGNGRVNALEHNIYNKFFDEYHYKGIFEILKLRLENLKLSSIFALKAAYVIGSIDNLDARASEIKALLTFPESKVLLPCNLYGSHWIGLLFEYDVDKGQLVKVFDSENKELDVNLVASLARSFAPESLSIEVVPVEYQRYGNCGPEVIENFVGYLTGERVSQEDAVPLHSKLSESFLLNDISLNEIFVPVHNAALSLARLPYTMLSNISQSIMALPDVASNYHEKIAAGNTFSWDLLRSFSGYLDIEWPMKKVLHFKEVAQFNDIMKRHNICKSFDVIRDRSEFKKSVLSKLHPDKECGDAADFVLAKGIADKLNSDFGELLNSKIQEVLPIINETTVGLKCLDSSIDFIRALSEPTPTNLKNAAIDAIYLYNMHSGWNVSLAFVAADALHHAYQGKYMDAINQSIMALSYFAMPMAIGYLGMPYINFAYGAGMLAYGAYSVANNAYSLYGERSSDSAASNSAIAYKALYECILSPIQCAYDSFFGNGLSDMHVSNGGLNDDTQIYVNDALLTDLYAS